VFLSPQIPGQTVKKITRYRKKKKTVTVFVSKTSMQRIHTRTQYKRLLFSTTFPRTFFFYNVVGLNKVRK
jgi:hypothetical protein